MKIAINRDWGGFPYPYDSEYEKHRDNPELIKLVLAGEVPGVQVVEIPDTTTDWEINNYDGMESVIYVVDGLLHHNPKKW